MKRVFLMLWGLVLLACSTGVFAVVGGGTTVSGGLGEVATNITSNVGAIAGLMIAICYVGGLGFVIGGIVKLKAHKDTPTQVAMSVGLVWSFLGILLLFLPTIVSVLGKTLFGSSTGSLVSVTGSLITLTTP